MSSAHPIPMQSFSEQQQLAVAQFRQETFHEIIIGMVERLPSKCFKGCNKHLGVRGQDRSAAGSSRGANNQLPPQPILGGFDSYPASPIAHLSGFGSRIDRSVLLDGLQYFHAAPTENDIT